MRKLVQGNEACVEAAISAGVRFFAGYPITPASEIVEGMAKQLPRFDGVFIQMEDEIGSIAACIGASIAGAKAMTATSGPGVSLMLENLGFAAMAEIPLLVVNVMRMGPSTGMPTFPAQMDLMQARWGSHGDYPVIAFTPSSVQETFELTIKAVNTAEMLRTPVFLLTDASVGHMREAVDLPNASEIDVFDRVFADHDKEDFAPYRIDPTGDSVPQLPRFGDGYRFHVDSNVHDEYGFPASARHDIAGELISRLNDKVENIKRQIILVEEYRMEDAEWGIFAFGSTARSAAEAVDSGRRDGFKVGMLKALTIWPFPEYYVDKWTNTINGWLVPEMNLGQMEGEVRKIVAGRIPVYPVNRFDGRLIEPKEIVASILAVTEKTKE